MSTTTKPITATQVRQQFIDFFTQRAGHSFYPSSPVVPHDDPTLLFINAGMNQFKPVFLDQVAPGSPLAGMRRAVNSQKCIRAGGKHNDLDDVGKDTYHHTFFEMLGNWSFGDYFKAESIQWAWELLVDIWCVDPDRLYATYFEGSKELGLDPDREAFDLWSKYLPAERILPGSMKDNFWEMGETGPCGPCSEVHFDGRDDAERARVPGHMLVNRESPDVIEIWNLVFIQFNRTAGSLDPLPARHVDTGMGLERIVRVLQGRDSTYDTDAFGPLFARIKEVCKAPEYTGSLTSATDMAYRVIADHVRTLAIAIADGAEPSNDGRGYVLRRILRRAVRYGRQTLGVPGAFLCELVPAVVQSLGDAYPELREQADHVTATIRGEEESFGRTLDHGLALFDQAAKTAQIAPSGADHLRISAEDGFKLHDTYGFPIDLTRIMAEERGMTVDEAGFERLMHEARERSRAGAGSEVSGLSLPATAIGDLRRLGVHATDDAPKFESKQIRATIKAIWNGTDFDENIIASNTRPADRFGLILDHTSFYAAMGGQVSDSGRITVDRGANHGTEFHVEDVIKCGDYVIHVGCPRKGEIRVGEGVRLKVEPARRAKIQSNHTATHLLNLALRDVIGDGADQKGSLVAPDRLRFDFVSTRGVDDSQALAIETIVRRAIDADLVVHARDVPLENGNRISGLRAVFGETYPDPVRVVSIGVPIDDLLGAPEKETWRSTSIEFCGGTHVASTREIDSFVITAEEAVSKGVRRLTALTGADASASLERAERLDSRIQVAASLDGASLPEEIREIENLLDTETLPYARRVAMREAIEPLTARARQAQKASAGAGRDRAVEQARSLAAESSGPVIVGTIDAKSDRQAVLAAMDTVRARHPEAAVLLISGDDDAGKVTIVASVAEAQISAGLKAGEWVRHTSQIVGGKGGGRPDSAQGGGTDPAKVPDALNEAIAFARQHAIG